MNKVIEALQTNFFLIFFLASWLIRAWLVPYEVSKRVNRPFLFGVILPEEKETMTLKEKRYLQSSTLVGFFGFVAFFISFFIMFQKMR